MGCRQQGAGLDERFGDADLGAGSGGSFRVQVLGHRQGGTRTSPPRDPAADGWGGLHLTPPSLIGGLPPHRSRLRGT